MGTRLTPEDAFRFARGEEVVSTSGVPAKLRHPLDFLVVTDHSNYLGLPIALKEGNPAIVADPAGKKLYDGFKQGGEASFKLFADLAKSMSDNQPLLDTRPVAEIDLGQIRSRRRRSTTRPDASPRLSALNGPRCRVATTCITTSSSAMPLIRRCR